MVMREGASKIVNFITLGARIPVLGCDHINHIVQKVLPSLYVYNIKNDLVYTYIALFTPC